MTVLLDVEDLAVRFDLGRGRSLQAVRGVGFTLRAGETLGVVGESGCGKSTLARAILRLIEPSAGRVLFEGRDLCSMPKRAVRRERRHAQLVFQDPMASLDPRFTIGRAVAEPLVVHAVGDRRARRERVADLLARVGLDPAAAGRYPHELSGGQRQRVGIARALALEPKLLLLDEPVSALDVSIQAQVLNLLIDLKAERGLAYLFISHDLAVVRAFADRVAVMYLGDIVEIGPAERLYAAPAHPYTQALLAAVPRPGAARGARATLKGEAPNPEDPPPGCPFHTRCPKVMDRCRTISPPSVTLDGGQAVRCHLYG